MLFLVIFTLLASSVLSSSNSNINRNTPQSNDEVIGKAHRAMTYCKSENIKNATTVLHFQGHPLEWYRLDDGVMGGKSLTDVNRIAFHENVVLSFRGTINTDGGGFTSIRAALPYDGLPDNVDAIRIRYRGDGKTYKLLLADGQRSTGGPFARSPTWQIDLPTEKRHSTEPMQETVLQLSQFLPSFGPRRINEEEKKMLKMHPSDQRLIGLMLSLKLSDGSTNPVPTFGEGEFDFNLDVESIDPVHRQ